jgi:ferric-dicitrate binding protein FerR (iron transport regulator)
MTPITCLRTEGLLDQRAAGLSAAEALRLEEHLSSCARCGHKARALGALRELVAHVDCALTPFERQRVFDAALREAAAVQPAPSALHALRAPLLGLAALAAGLLAVGPWLMPGDAPAEPASSVAMSTPGLSPVAQLADGATLRAERAMRVQLAHAVVELDVGTQLRWDASARAVWLDAGSVRLDVDATRGQSFSVSTGSFRALVLGTRFSVSLAGVQVDEGRVRVTDLAGRELRVLAAGERFDVAQAAAQAVAAQPVAMDEALPSPRPARGHGAVSSGSRAPEQGPRVDAASLLDSARLELANQRVARARAALDAALAAALSPTQRAEALSLRADCALVSGDHAGAIEAYLRVARAYPKLPAGETALFSAARLEMERGRSASAARSLAHYLERYPSGRFIKEAQSRLRQLNRTLDHEP